MTDRYPHTEKRKFYSDSKGFPFSITLFIISLALIIAGFVVLLFVTRDASNLPGIMAPILLVSGYVLAFISLLKKKMNTR